VNVGWRNGLVEEIHVGEPQGYPIEAETADAIAECEKKDAFPPHRGASVRKAILVGAVETTGAAVSRLLHARGLWLGPLRAFRREDWFRLVTKGPVLSSIRSQT